jgi:ankyrin repeat protein
MKKSLMALSLFSLYAMAMEEQLPNQQVLDPALETAIRTHNPEDVKVALRNNANVNAPDSVGNKPLSLAIKNLTSGTSNANQIVKILIDAGADVNGTGFAGRTPLYEALDVLKTFPKSKSTRPKAIEAIALLLKNKKAKIRQEDINFAREFDPGIAKILEELRTARPQHAANVAFQVERNPQPRGPITDSKLSQFGLPKEMMEEIFKRLQ